MDPLKTYIGASLEGLLSNRVENAAINLQEESRSIVEAKKKEFRILTSKLVDLLDLGIQTTTSLQPNLEKMGDPAEWAESLHTFVAEAILLSKEIEISVNTHNALFPDNKVGGLTKKMLKIIQSSSAK